VVKPVFSLSSTRPYTDTCSADFKRVFSVFRLTKWRPMNDARGIRCKDARNQVWMVSSTQITPPSKSNAARRHSDGCMVCMK
jgi:hypothetical protein